MPLFICACALTAGLYWKFRKRAALMLPIFAILGCLLVVRSLAPTCDVLEDAASARRFVRVEGMVEDIGLTRTGNQRITLRAISFAIGPEQEIHPSTVRLRVFLPEHADDVTLGQRVVVSGLLLELDEQLNPGSFNEAQFLRARGIEYKIFAESLLWAGENYLTPAMRIRLFGLRLAEIFDEVLEPWQAGIMRAMIVGDRSGLDSEVTQNFRYVGIFHILVVSGLHLNILSTTLEKLLLKAKLNRKLTSPIIIAFIIIYTILTGAGIATMRAAVMGTALVLGKLLRQEGGTISSLCLAAILLLLYQPMFLFEVGFIYSFGMVLGLSLGHKPMERLIWRARWKLPRARKFFDNWYTKKYLPTALAAMLAYIPINAYFFFFVSPVKVLMNFILIPSVVIVITFGFLMAVAGLFSSVAAQALSLPVRALLEIYDLVSRGALQMPFSVIRTGRPGFVTMIVLVGVPVGLVYILRIYGMAYHGHMRRLVAAALTAALLSFAMQAVNPNVNVTFLYVGQGDGAVIHCNSSAVIIDGGGAFGRDIGTNTGIFTLLPYLNYRGINQAYAIASHNHLDHTIGIIEAMLEGRVSRLFVAAASVGEDYIGFDLMMQAAEASGTPVSLLQAGDVLQVGRKHFEVLHPEADSAWSGNNASLVIRLIYGDTSVLFTGDIEREAEAAILEAGINVTADVLKIAHHGSRTSTTPEFLAAVSPDVAVMSAGRNNMFNHPHPTTLRTLRADDVPYVITSESGAVLMRTNGRRITIHTMR